MKKEYIIEDLSFIDNSKLALKLWCADKKSNIEVCINGNVKILVGNTKRIDLDGIVIDYDKNINYGYDYSFHVKKDDRIKVSLYYFDKIIPIFDNYKYNFIKKAFILSKRFVVNYHFIIPSYILKRRLQKFINKIRTMLNMDIKNLNPISIGDYNFWLSRKKQENVNEEVLKYKPLISIAMPVFNVPIIYLKECIDSVINQTYKNWELCIADDCSTDTNIKKILEDYRKKERRIKIVYRKENGHISLATNSAIKLASGDFIGLIDNDDKLDKNALFEVVKALNKDRKLDIIYTDEDKLRLDGIRCDPHLKPDFSLDTFLSQNYLCHFTVIRKSIIEKIGGFRKGYEGAQDFDLFLRASTQTNKIHHIAKILYHWRMIPGSTAMSISSKNYACERGRQAVVDYLENKGIKANVESYFTSYLIKYEIDPKERVAIILNGSDNKKNIIKTINSIIVNTKYNNYEIFINSNKMKNINLESNIDITFANITTSYIKNNINCDFLCFYEIGNTIVSSNEWLNILTGYARQEHVGLVSGKVLFKNDFIKNSSYIIGKKNKKNLVKDCYKGFHKDAGMTAGRLILPYNYTAVNNLITVTNREKFIRCLGNKTFDYKSIELSLTMINNNYLNVLIPYVETKSYKNFEKNIGKFKSMKEYDMFFKKDKYYNENYSISSPFYLK